MGDGVAAGVRLEVFARPVGTPRVARIAENRSPLHHTLVSMERETGMPCARSAQVCG
ncbi:hypothetical protein [Streptomyces sp. SM1]|uniref:hypothetical protein n=1 Tax=Streptomyces sp. SM1 TaxID=402229 RepID=UPI0021565432|nr:hypothetical protein [Streptomyces sp. SM1]